jgi:hypothetical protein
MSLYNRTDGGELHRIIKLKIDRVRNKRSISISQEIYVDEILEEAEMTQCKEMTAPQYTAATDDNNKPLDDRFKQYLITIVAKIGWQ